MAPPFPINPAAIPIVATRKALLVLDFQNDFLSPDGVLYVEEPEGFVDRTLELVKVFRDSGAGDVIWVRSEFEHHRPVMAEGDQIVTSEAMVRPQRATPARGRQPVSEVHDSAVMEADEEAFLSVGPDGDKKPPCVRKGSSGANLPPHVQAAVDSRRDIIFTKTHYSAFAASGQQQLVQILRGRFVTQMYMCGALTNISVYATALDAGQHGYDMTIVEDCCGYRKAMRHINAVRQLVHLTGSEMISSEALLTELQPPTAAPSQSTGLSPSISGMALSMDRSGSPGRSRSPASAPQRAPASPRVPLSQPDPDRRQPKAAAPPRRVPSKRSNPDEDTKRSPKHIEALTSDSDSDSSSPASDSPRQKQEKNTKETHGSKQAAAAANQSERESSKGPAHVPGSASAKPEKHRKSDKETPSSPVQRSTSSAPSSPDPQLRGAAVEKPTTSCATTAATSLDPKSEDHSHMADQHPARVVSEPLCEGDTTVITDVLPPALAANAFERLLDEVSWSGMSHLGGEVPRRVAVQGSVDDDGSMPVYRHPSDESPPLLPFSPTVLQIKHEVERNLGHLVNHVLIQHYRSGNDYISEHSDKTLDIVKGSFIANVSLGAERTMVFRTKRPPKEDTSSKPDETNPGSDTEKARRQIQRAALPHNSLCRMGLTTNERWLHAIRQDKRSDRDKTPSELSHGGARISLTFRRIGTFLDESQSRIWGQGATSKTKEGARPVVNGQTPDAVRLLRAFGAENHASEFDWEGHYGEGFDVLHMGVPKRVFYASGAGVDQLGNVRVALALAELGVGAARGSVEAAAGTGDDIGGGGDVRFEDNDPGRTAVHGHATVLRYLDAVYGAGRRYDQLLPAEVGRRFERLQRGLELLGKWRCVWKAVAGVQQGLEPDDAGDKQLQQQPQQQQGAAARVRASEELSSKVAKLLAKELAGWEAWAKEAASASILGVSKPAPKPKAKPEEKDGDADEEQQQHQQQSVFYIAGGTHPSPADFALWPVLHDMVRVCGEGVLLVGEREHDESYLRRYYAAFRERSAVAKVVAQFKLE
ncbi:hypothetical protein N656DRAFT_836583 [Canariomyces notabilis]|uniref:Fe2OG dioxygenase domain-containing protein n=1 Tax=Canariomyces notabilis TaxID=2074819 RepID=A0AAN6YT45_9PEZI|nr:hypothetical protein N656DRAFT_836583 [Canariomyces arenarius]